MELQPGVVEADVARLYSSLSVIETDRHSILERVADQLGAIGIHDLERICTPDGGILLETVILQHPRLHHIYRARRIQGTSRGYICTGGKQGIAEQRATHVMFSLGVCLLKYERVE